MGVLDDAIREHLELKRQHGAPEEEVLRQEEEALGPARREVATADSAEAAPEQEAAPAEPEAAEAEEVSPDEVEHPAAEKRAPDTVESEPVEAEAHDAPFDAEALDEPARPTRVLEATDVPPPSDPDVEEPTGTTPAGGFEHLDEDEDEDDLPDEEDEHPDAESEDVLEDTPDFLQETPEHDRLWFEQKPPRDFDFD